MKFTYIIYFISIFQLFYSIELGGMKFAITEKMMLDVVNHYYPAINKEISSIKLGDVNIMREFYDYPAQDFRNIVIRIINFTTDKVKITIGENGININISCLKAKATAISYHDKKTDNINTDINLYVKSLNKYILYLFPIL